MPTLNIPSLEGPTFSAYCAKPVSGFGPGIVIIQEIFGVNAGMRQLCDDFAEKGFVAVCPDLFWRQEPNVELTDQSQAEWDHAFKLMNGFDVEAGLRDLLSCMAWLRKAPECSGKVGAVGYCLGGKMAFLLSERSDVDATVSYYGVGLDTLLGDVADIRMPTLLHIAELDKFVPADAREKILGRCAKNSAITSYVYANVDHAFARPNGQHYHAASAELANSRTLSFLEQSLLA